jgi:hypothetical protein
LVDRAVPTAAKVSDELRQPPVHAQLRWLDSVKAGLTLVFVRDWHPVLRDPLDLVPGRRHGRAL